MSERSPSTRDRLDREMVSRGLASTRSRAQDLIRRGLVLVDGVAETAPARPIAAGEAIALAAHAASSAHVSRGGEKLAAALAQFGFDVAGRAALDVGASTGGFTRVLLDRGAARVYAVDVGRGQLHASLAGDPRVINLEGRDARKLAPGDVPMVDAIVADVSFISLTKVLPSVLPLARPGAWLVALIKPQFEVGRANVGKGGIVRDTAARTAAIESIRAFLARQPRWHVTGVMQSPITGGSGNIEYLIGAELHAS